MSGSGSGRVVRKEHEVINLVASVTTLSDFDRGNLSFSRGASHY